MEKDSSINLLSLLGIRESVSVREELYARGFRPIDGQNLIIYEKDGKRIVYDETEDKILSEIE